MYDYSRTTFFQYFLADINKYFSVTSKEVSELSYLNLHTIQSPYGISIDKTYQIKDTSLVQWFPDTTEHVNYAPTPFKADSAFDFSLE